MKSTAETDQVGNTGERWAVEKRASKIEADYIKRARTADRERYNTKEGMKGPTELRLDGGYMRTEW